MRSLICCSHNMLNSNHVYDETLYVNFVWKFDAPYSIILADEFLLKVGTVLKVC